MKRYINTIKSVFEIAPGKVWLVISLFISAAIRSAGNLLPPIATSGIIKVLTENNFNGIWFYVLLYIIFYGIYFFGCYLNYDIYGKLGHFYHILGQKKIIDHVSKNEDIFGKVSKGKILATCSEDVQYIVDVIDSLVEIVIGVIQLLIILVIFIHYSIWTAIIALLVDILYIKLMSGNSKLVAKHYEATRKQNDKIMDLFNQMLMGIKQVKTSNLLPNLEEKIDKSHDKWRSDYVKRRYYLTERYSKIPIIIYLGKLFLYIFLGYLVCNEKLTIDILILLISYFEMTISKTDVVLERMLNLDSYGIRINRIKTILNAKNNTITDFGNIENDYITGLAEFKNVTYKYKSKIILDNISFKLYPNTINTIVGPKGSGKTTIVNLLYRLIKLNKGNIYIDNVNIYEYSNKVYPSNVSGVYQKPFIFDMSIKDNLGLVNKNVDEQIAACKKVGLHQMIVNLPNGYNTKITEDNNIFDDNQKQLLMIARSIISKAEILLFDEITSHTDEKTTKKIQKIIEELKENHTIVMVTHNKDIMLSSDRIIVLDKGKVVAEGTKDEVKKNCSLFKELIKKEFVTASNINE